MAHRKNSWRQIILGVAMLGSLALGLIVKLANTYGTGRAITSVVGGMLLAAWILAGVVLIVRGLDKM